MCSTGKAASFACVARLGRAGQDGPPGVKDEGLTN